MLTISKPLSAGQAQTYHRAEFANARDNYYTEGNQVLGEWHGKLAAQWGLAGAVDAEHFGRLANGQHPWTGDQVVQHRAAAEYLNHRGEKITTMEHRAGWDATLSAPKTVSLTALVGGDERIREAHRESVNVALDEIEKYVQARVGGNHLPETTGEWIAAKFEHDSSRPVDGYAAPQLHTHVVFFNITERENGEVRALQPRELYRSQQYATAVYRSELAVRLERLGYEVEPRSNGAPEIKGYSQEYIDASSPRRQQIKEYLVDQGINSAEAAEIAAHRTRGAKLEVSHEDMQRLHRQVAEKHGNQPEQVVLQATSNIQHTREPSEEHMHKVVERAITYARDKNLERDAVVDERALLRDALKRSMTEASLEEVRAQFNHRIERGGLIEVEQQAGVPGRALTTMEMIRLERENLRLMRDGQEQLPEMATFEARREVDGRYSHLSNSQRGAIEQVLSSRDQLTGLEGVAGAGKTTTLTAIRDATQREGYQVEGFAPTSRAAQKLEEAGIESSTLQRHLARGEQLEKAQKHLYVLDESSLASTKQVNEFLHRLRVDDRVLLVGDVRQHEAVEAGKPFQQFQEAGLRTARLDEILRQKDSALKEAVEQLAAGDVRSAVNNLARHGRVHEIEDRGQRLARIAHEYAERPHGTLVVSPDNESRRELNVLIHQELRSRGHVQQQEHNVRVLEPRQELTGADRAWSRSYQPGDVLRYSKGSETLGIEAGEYAAVRRVESENQNLITVERQGGELKTYDPRRLRGVSVYRESERQFSEGDRVQFTAPSKELHVANRELGTLSGVDQDGSVTVHTDSGRTVRFGLEDHPHLDHGYAVTSHSSQGQTADRVLIHVDTEKGEKLVNRRLAYVSVSRGRYDAQIYTNDKTQLAHHLSRDVSGRTAIEQEHSEHHGHEQEAGHRVGPSSVGHDSHHARGGAEQSHEQSSGQGQGQAIGE
jgi:conjugative relaxase-like TrwC/TraI family protein